MEKKFLELKDGLDISDLLFLDPTVLEMLAHIASYAHEHGLSCVVTSLREEVPGRKFRTHAEGRAADLSVREWSPYHIQTLLFKFKRAFKGRGAFNTNGDNRPIVYHKVEGGGYHFHVQTHPRRAYGE